MAVGARARLRRGVRAGLRRRRARSSRSRWRGRAAAPPSAPRPVGTVKAAGTVRTSRAGLGQRAVEMREAQVVADGQAERRRAASPRPPPGRRAGRPRIRGRSRRRRRRRRTCGSCRSAPRSPPSGPIRKQRLAKRPSASPVFSERGCRSASQTPALGRHLAQAAPASGPPPRARSTARWRARLAPTQVGALGRAGRASAPPAAASRTSASVTGRFAAGSSAEAELDQRGAHASAGEQRVEPARARRARTCRRSRRHAVRR